MNKITVGSRGAAVEDIQRRLMYLGYSIGTSGVDGVFLDETAEAVKLFQASLGLIPDGVVDSETWTQLVDSTFRFGDRLLYLRYPLFHGRDVEILQTALNSLGFMTGEIDGIFGPGTESAVGDFQTNISIPADGVVGFATYEALQSMKHMWEGREIISHSEARKKTSSRRDVLKEVALTFNVWSPRGLRIARRIQNLATASFSDAEVTIENFFSDPRDESYERPEFSEGGRPIIEVGLQLDACAVENAPHSCVAIVLNFEKSMFIQSLREVLNLGTRVSIQLFTSPDNDLLNSGFSNQAVAVYILDAICEALT